MKKAVLVLLILVIAAFAGCTQEKNPYEASKASAQNVGYDVYDPAVEKFREFEASDIPSEDLERVRQKIQRLKPETEEQDKGQMIQRPSPEAKTHEEEKQSTPATAEIKKGLLSPRGCNGTGSFMLGASPLALEDIEKIRPMGGLSSVHITPTDHQYWDTLGNNIVDDKVNLDRFKVHAPGDGNIVEIGFMDGDYRVIIEHTCNFYTIFIHVDKLTDEIMATAGLQRKPGEQVWPRIPVKEGQVIGSIGVGKLDFSVVDESVTLKGFAIPESYEGEVWKIHTVDTFDYYEEPLRSQLIAKNLRTTTPLGGKIDYDVDGRLVGNWFKEGTGKYSGGPGEYWKNHLSIVYDSIDPSQIRIGVGNIGGWSLVYGVTGNSPDPASVGIETGVVKYELATFEYYVSSGEKWDKVGFAKGLNAENTDDIRGVALFQLLPDGKLKAEFFPDKKAAEVAGFTASAMIYER
ncbi:M23 family metallopeptidase [Candidatus Woesearchaeota archaeon]|nr:M23 family metallopeptidase [Candidatus Woesearchaeota archaeon]